MENNNNKNNVKRDYSNNSVVDMINQIIEDGKDLKTKEEEIELINLKKHEEWVKSMNEKAELDRKKWEAKIAAAKKAEEDKRKLNEQKAINDPKIEQELEKKRLEQVEKHNKLVEENIKKEIKKNNIARVTRAMRERKHILSKDAWLKEAQKWQKLLEQVSR